MGVFSKRVSKQIAKAADEEFENRSSFKIGLINQSRAANERFAMFRHPSTVDHSRRRKSRLRFNPFISGALRRDLNR